MGSLQPPRRDAGGQRYGDLGLLLSDHHPEESVLGVKDRGWTQDEFLERVLEGGYNHEGNHFGGFVLLSLGDTEAQPADPIGFCLQRCATKVSELGPFTRSTALAACLGDEAEAAKMLKKYTANDQTVLRQSFNSAEGECVNLDYLRFLLTKVGLKNVKIHHFLYYRHGKFLNGFLEYLQQLRHELKLAGGSDLKEQSVKLTMNSCYGHSMMRPTSFTETTVVSEKTLGRKTYARQLGAGGRITQLTLLGVDCPDSGCPSLTYAVTRSREDAKILNLVQMGASILSSSRVIFLSLLHEMLRLLDPSLAQLCYVGEYHSLAGASSWTDLVFSPQTRTPSSSPAPSRATTTASG